jgi:hypothetical protein
MGKAFQNVDMRRARLWKVISRRICIVVQEREVAGGVGLTRGAAKIFCPSIDSVHMGASCRFGKG